MKAIERMNGIPTRILGRTGLRVTVLCVGGYHIGKDRDPKLGVGIIRTAIDEGVNFLDNAWCYNEGESEKIMELALKNGYREPENAGRNGGSGPSRSKNLSAPSAIGRTWR